MRVLILCLFTLSAGAQTMSDCKRRFDSYINFRNSLATHVQFSKNVMHLATGGRKILAVYEDELVVLAKLFQYSPLQRQLQVMNSKGLRHYTPRQLDSLDATVNDLKSVIEQPDSLPLRGYRVALDPGHFGTDLKTAAVEQKYLHFVRPGQSDTVMLFESLLTFHTAVILKHLLEEQGAAVFMTREQPDHTSFGCTFDAFFTHHKKRTLDSLMAAGQLNAARHRRLMSCKRHDFFWEFFRDFDLANRGVRINRFDPHVSAIIHYNVDEKNVPWTKTTRKNFTMAFIGGAMTGADVVRDENRMHLLRLLITDQLDRSEKLAAETVQAFADNLKVPVARPEDAKYLYQNCLRTPSAGVFCRNLVLCRKINSPLVYGESLYQDNEKECVDLMRCNVSVYGLTTSERVTKVAASYFEALFSFLSN